MKLHILAAAALAVAPGSASAATLIISLTGTVMEQITPGSEPSPIALGDQLNLSATIDTSLVRPWDDNGVTIASFYRTGTFSLSLGGYSWRPGDEILDGDMATLDGIAAPALLFRDNRVVGLIGHMAPPTGATPDLRFLNFNPNFLIGSRQHLYANTYDGAAFRGQWNFASSIAAVPEPETWALFILGFAGIGLAARRRRSPAALGYRFGIASS